MRPIADCPACGRRLPVVRKPSSWRQALWGGWTCPSCGAEVDAWGNKVGQAGAKVAGRPRSWTRDDSTAASHPADLRLDDAALRRFCPELYRPLNRLLEAVGLAYPRRLSIAEHLLHADARAAVVITTRPLRVAAYSDDFDRIAMLAFDEDPWLVEEHRLRPGSRLITVNGYRREGEPDADLFLAKDRAYPWTGFGPLIGDFLSADVDRLHALRAEIAEAEWRRAEQLGRLYLERFPGLARNGRPLECFVPATRNPSS
ncbi:hypothetical protein OJF2_04100 [Aquisphaera giovannonii]|uniref:Uncharacterized protein n=1 Tax=Aquisphaera giovannonii TaxID=406548 RepID=A0A5B9VU88_9BACT|nr:hypothetical protein [Aquisphaera giovannonii]QEH31943.1 hypothetical protein OJF2_04100 [Aquisphaera giovannonii]